MRLPMPPQSSGPQPLSPTADFPRAPRAHHALPGDRGSFGSRLWAPERGDHPEEATQRHGFYN